MEMHAMSQKEMHIETKIGNRTNTKMKKSLCFELCLLNAISISSLHISVCNGRCLASCPPAFMSGG